jgi:hypothetical protein
MLEGKADIELLKSITTALFGDRSRPPIVVYNNDFRGGSAVHGGAKNSLEPI